MFIRHLEHIILNHGLQYQFLQLFRNIKGKIKMQNTIIR